MCWAGGGHFLTRLALKMCKVGKVGSARSLSGRGGKDVSSQVGKQVELLFLSCVVNLGPAECWRLDSSQSQNEARFTQRHRRVYETGSSELSFLYLAQWGLVELQGLQRLDFWGTTGAAG